MNKSELVSTIARRTEMSEKDVNAVLGEFITVVGEVVAKGQDKLTIPGFISFEQTERKARMGRNPRTGESVALAGKHVPHFKPGKELRERVSDAMPVDEAD